MNNNRRTFLIGTGAAGVLALAGSSIVARAFAQETDAGNTPEQGAASPVEAAPQTDATPAATSTVSTLKNYPPVEGYIDQIEGNPQSTVTVIEYASPTCPHCAAFSNDVYPALKAKYIDNNQIQFIIRPFIRNQIDAAIFMIAKAAGPANFHKVIETYFKTQGTWATSDKPRDAIYAVAQQLGFTEETFNAALDGRQENQDYLALLNAMREQALNDYKLTGTPTFYVNEKLISGEQSLDALSAEIDPLLG